MLQSGANYLNVSFDTLVDFGWSTEPHVDTVTQLGDHDPSQRGFSLRNAELSLDGAVDPYLKGFANIVLKLDNENETVRHYRERVRQCEAVGEYALAEQIRGILVQEQDHQIDLATALGKDVAEVTSPQERV